MMHHPVARGAGRTARLAAACLLALIPCEGQSGTASEGHVIPPFEIVTTQVEQVPVPEWVFVAPGRPPQKRHFRYADMLYPNGRFKDHWRTGQSVSDVSRPETKLWFHFLGASFIDVGCEAIHLGQTELMNHNDRELHHYAQVLALIRAHAARQPDARVAPGQEAMVSCQQCEPGGA
ncbi:MAG: hypothetical protein JXQ71_17855 [Verrucomicrobia bacterium]|nr:hypothetical protein [Verrucomicrobiota bacterium]